MNLRERLKKIGYDKLLLVLIAGIVLICFSLPSGSKTADGSGGSGSASDVQSASDDTAEGTAQLDMDSIVYAAAERYCDEMEQKVKALLQTMDGVGSVEVMITFEGSGELVLQEDRSYQYDYGEESGSLTHSDGSYTTVIIQGEDAADTPIVIKMYNPQVEGVVVVAQGAQSAVIKTEITEALMVLFGIESHKIKVLTMSDLE